jgi:hypothetical protein
MTRAFLPLTLAALYFAYVFRLPDGTPGRAGLGDWLDPYFINYVLEHWYHVVTTFSNPRSPLMFFPVPDTLGYSHSLILYAPFYVVARLFLDPFQAYSLTIALVLVLGTVCLYLLLRQAGVALIEALLLTAFFATSGNVVNSMTNTWTQTASVFLIPPALLMIATALRMAPGRGRMAVACAGAFVGGLIFSQEFYTGAFAALFVILLVALPALVTRGVRACLRALWRFTVSVFQAFAADAQPPGRPSRIWLVVAGAFVILGAALFIQPIDRTEIGSFRFSARDPWRPLSVGLLAGLWFAGQRWRLPTRLARAARSARRDIRALIDIFLGTLQSWIPRADGAFVLAVLAGLAVSLLVFLTIYLGSFLEHRGFSHEELLGQLKEVRPDQWANSGSLLKDVNGFYSLRSFGFALVLGVLVLAFLRADSTARRYGLWFLFVSLLVLIAPLRIGGFSPWLLLFAWWPGLSAIRGVARIIYLYELALALVTAFFLIRARSRVWWRVAVVAGIAVLLLTDWNRTTFQYSRPSYSFQEWVLGRIDVDPSCRSFFIKRASQRYMSRADDKRGLYNIDAMFIALRYSMPTLNGYSAFEPEAWGLANPHLPDYLKRVNEWIDRYGLRNVCALDIDNRIMRPYPRP